MNRSILASALITAGCLIGGPLAGVGLLLLLSILSIQPAVAWDAALMLLAIMSGGALWGWLLARRHGIPNRGALALAGALSVGPAVIVAGISLARLEHYLVAPLRMSSLPAHVLYPILFGPAAFLVTTIGSAALLFASRKRSRWLVSALVAGAAGALAFLATNLLMDLLGYRVGAPHAADRYTMLTATFVGATCAALAGGAVIGQHLVLQPASPSIADETPALVSPPPSGD